MQPPANSLCNTSTIDLWDATVVREVREAGPSTRRLAGWRRSTEAAAGRVEVEHESRACRPVVWRRSVDPAASRVEMECTQEVSGVGSRARQSQALRERGDQPFSGSLAKSWLMH